LENALKNHSNFQNKENFDPHQATDAADRLARRLADEPDEVRRVVCTAGKAFEEAAKQASAMLAVAWLEDLIPRYRNVGLTEDAIRVEKAIRERAEQMRAEMKTVSHSIEISKDKMDAWVEAITEGDLRATLARIALQCMTREDEIRKNLLDLVEDAPLSSMMSMVLTGPDGFTEAVVKSVEEDMEGRSIKQAADVLQWNQIFIHNAFAATRAKYGLDVDLLVEFLSEAPFFAVGREALLREGLSAWLAEDAVKAIHVLVPQVEATCRNLLAMLGASVRRHDPNYGGFRVIGMGEVVNHPRFGVPKDIRFNLRALFCDPRGLNLRNHLAHGIASIGLFNVGLANWVVHSLLMLAVLRLHKPDEGAIHRSGDAPPPA
jgi:hypothetical protein